MTSTSSATAPSTPTPDGAPPASDGGNPATGGMVERVTNVTSEAPAQASRVIDDAKNQLSGATQRSLADLRTQADDRTAQAAQGLRSLSSQVDALVNGRPDEAGNLTGIVESVGQHATDLAGRLDADGVQGVVDDVSRFGRQHPWAFLGLSVGAGFLVGRLVRTTAAVAGDGQLTTSSTAVPAAAEVDGVSTSQEGPSGVGAPMVGVDR